MQGCHAVPLPVIVRWVVFEQLPSCCPHGAPVGLSLGDMLLPSDSCCLNAAQQLSTAMQRWQWAGAGHQGQQSCWTASLGGPVLFGTACDVPYSTAEPVMQQQAWTPPSPPIALQAHAGGQAERAACDSNGPDVCQRAGQVSGHWRGDAATPGRACPPLQPQGGAVMWLEPALLMFGNPTVSSRTPQGCGTPSSTRQQADILVPATAVLQPCGPDACVEVCQGRITPPGSGWCTSTTLPASCRP